jgi:hypothetical protein
MEKTRAGPTIRLPCAYGARVWHQARRENIAGMVTGYHIRPNSVLIAVTWGDNLAESSHYFHELTTEFQSDFTPE